MKIWVKEFFKRGLMFSGFGPIILGIIYFIISKVSGEFILSAEELLLGIVSIYILAFVQAGASVFNQIDSWSIPKSLFFHFSSLYVAYVLCYLLNTWIPFEPMVILIFTIIFVVVYFVVWLTVYLIIKKTSQTLNKTL